MTEATLDKVIQSSFRPSFFLWMTLAIAFFIFSGFGMTYFQPMATGSLGPLPPIVHIHGLFFSSWIILLVVQALLVNIKNIALHRSLGTFGIGLGTGLILMGTLITLLSLSPAESYNFDAFGLTYLSFIAVVTFATLFIYAIRKIRRIEQHKRLILLATIAILPPGINRLYMMSLELPNVPFLATYLTMDALIAAIVIHEWRTLGKVATSTIIGAAAIIIPEILLVPITGSESFSSLNDFLHGLVYYR